MLSSQMFRNRPEIVELQNRVRRLEEERQAVDDLAQAVGRVLLDVMAREIGIRKLGELLKSNGPNVCAMRRGRRRISSAMFLNIFEVIDATAASERAATKQS